MMEMQSKDINELAAALSKAQGEIKPALRDKDNPFYKSKYADLAAVWDACRVPLAKHGLAVVQTVETSLNGRIDLVTTLVHSSGQWRRGAYPILAMPKDVKCVACRKNDVQIEGILDPQVLAKSFTYARRKSLEGITGVAPDDDDDGETAAGRGGNHKSSTRKAAPANMPAWREDATKLKDAIDAAKTVKEVVDTVASAGELLKTIKADNKDTYAFFIDRANKREAALAQESPEHEPAR